MKTTINLKTTLKTISNATSSEVLRDYKSFTVDSANLVNLIKSCYVARYSKLNNVTTQQLGEAFGMSKASACKMAKVGTFVLDHLETFLDMASKDYMSYRNIYDALVYNVNILDYKNGKAFNEALKEAKKARKGETTDTKKEDKGGKVKNASKGKKALKVEDLEKMNSTQLYQAVISLYNGLQEDGTSVEILTNEFVETINKLKK